MDSLDKELGELKGFIADLKSDRAAQKEKEKRESWTKYVSVSLVFVAVLAAIATQWAGKYSSRVLVSLNASTFDQAVASDTWNEYQANSIKENLYDALHQLPGNSTAGNPADSAKWESLYTAKTNKYELAKADKMAQAKAKEGERDKKRAAADDASTHGSGMGLATSIFQISIAMGSICIVTKKKWLWHVSLLLAVVATVKMVLVWLH
jgi:hypothetical protein